MSVRTTVVLLTLLLISCSTGPDIDPLEAKAQAGDPVAACQFAARELHHCALEKRRWELGEIAEEPACIADGLGEKASSYLDNVEFDRQDAGYVMFSLETISIRVTAVSLAISSADEAIKSTEEQQADCAALADFLK
jgi:hypothetical protein